MSNTKLVHDLLFNFGTAIPWLSIIFFAKPSHYAGVTVGGVITALGCEPTTITILPCLNHGNYFSSRTLVEFLDSSGKPTIGLISGMAASAQESDFLKN